MRFWAVILSAFLASCQARGVVVSSTGDPAFNLVSTSGPLGIPWDAVGNWNGFAATATGPREFITSSHVGGRIGDAFTVAGMDFRTTGRTISGDLAFWSVDSDMPAFASMQSRPLEVGERIIFAGLGGPRGSWNGGGWSWTVSDGSLRWGENTVSHVSSDYAFAVFNSPGLPFEGTVTAGDSGGPVFVERDGAWDLAGIIHGSTSPSARIGSHFLVSEVTPVPEPSAPSIIIFSTILFLALRRFGNKT